MEIEKYLTEAQGTLQKVVARITEIDNQIQALSNERQQLLQEALKLDGEIRGYNKIMEK